MKSFPIVSSIRFRIRSGLRARRLFAVACLSVCVLLCGALAHRTVPPAAAQQSRGAAQLRAAVVANSEAELQRVESALAGSTEAGLAHFLRGYLRLQAKDFTAAAGLLGDANIARQTTIGDYALYYRAQALNEAGRGEEAEREYRKLARNFPNSTLARAALLQAAGMQTLRGDPREAIETLAPLVEKNDGAALKLRADALEKMGRANDAVLTLRKLYFDAPQSPEAEKAAARLLLLGSSTAPAEPAQIKRRADKLYAAGLYAIAAQAYSQIPVAFPAETTDEVWYRAGLSSYKANAFRPAVDSLAHVPSGSKFAADALYYQGVAQLALSNEAGALQSLANLRRIAPTGERTAALLYDIGRFNEKRNSAEQAVSYYTQLVRQFPRADKADEAHFYVAWRAHQAKDFRSAARMLTEHVALYGAVTENRGRAGFWAALDSERIGDKARALVLYRAMLTRYGAGWFGLNSERHIAQLTAQGVRPAADDATLSAAVEGLQVISVPQESLKEAEMQRVREAEDLMRVGMYQSASNELDVARVAAPTSPLVNLRIAQIFRAQGENVAALNALKRAYPDYGQMLPQEMSREAWDVFYPLRWWATIKDEAHRHNIDPYLIAGLIRQETVFDPKARSRANAMGLMQLLPYVGQSVARKTPVGRITTSDLYNPVINIQLGTQYVKDLMTQFNGRFEYVAAAYNGGPTRVSRWLRESSTAEIEEWVENIPLSETRLYVQGVYRNARQYQRLYDDQGRFRSSVPE